LLLHPKYTLESQLFDDRELWEKIIHGDAEAFDTWYRENAPRLRSFLRRLLGNEQAAEDAMQETFTHIWRRPQGFDPERGTLRGYLFGAARRQAAEWTRRNSLTGELVHDPPAPDHLDTASIVADAFARLRSEQRTILWLREVEGQSYAELAAVLDVPVGTVRSRLFAAREALRAVWRSTPNPAGGPHELR
jgi:RNA polymerase sigma-70 factor (ECF subfamily)